MTPLLLALLACATRHPDAATVGAPGAATDPPPEAATDPPPEAGAIVLGHVDEDAVDRVLREAAAEIRACAAGTLPPGTSGTLVIRFRIDPDGRFAGGKVKASSDTLEPAVACMHATLLHTPFPPPSTGDVRVAWKVDVGS